MTEETPPVVHFEDAHSRVLFGPMERALPELCEPETFDSCVTDLAAGIAAEHLVCADLLLHGYRAFLADQNCPYDVAVEVAGRLIRLQVKATRAARSIPGRPLSPSRAYVWQTRRAGKGGRRVYGCAEFDVVACVALDIRVIAYIPVAKVVRQTLHLRPPYSKSTHPNIRHKTVNHYPFVDALLEVGGR